MSILAQATVIEPKRLNRGKEVHVQITYFNVEEGIVKGIAKSQTEEDLTYDVRLITASNQVSCSCPDFEYQAKPCKHIAALNMLALKYIAGISPSQITT